MLRNDPYGRLSNTVVADPEGTTQQKPTFTIRHDREPVLDM
jgi:hypothetical protein